MQSKQGPLLEPATPAATSRAFLANDASNATLEHLPTPDHASRAVGAAPSIPNSVFGIPIRPVITRLLGIQERNSSNSDTGSSEIATGPPVVVPEDHPAVTRTLPTVATSDTSPGSGSDPNPPIVMQDPPPAILGRAQETSNATQPVLPIASTRSAAPQSALLSGLDGPHTSEFLPWANSNSHTSLSCNLTVILLLYKQHNVARNPVNTFHQLLLSLRQSQSFLITSVTCSNLPCRQL